MSGAWPTRVFFAVIGFLFWVACRGAYEGYFSGDDLDNLAWTHSASLRGFLSGLVSPWFSAANFRPAGHLYFRLVEPLAGLDFRPYVAVLHAVHLSNTALVWRLAAVLGFGWIARAAAALFFVFPMAVFDALWKPMYIFDVLCAAFSLTAVLLWIARRPWWGLGAFWLAYKAKELAIAIPVVLAAYEFWLGSGAWRMLGPYALVSFGFGIQAIFASAGREGEYGLRLTPATLWQTLDFYASRLFRIPHGGFLLGLLPVWIRDRRLWWGLAAAALWLAPMLLVPGRQFGAYLYLPVAGVAIAVAALVERFGWKRAALPLAAWLLFQFAWMRVERRAALAEAHETKAYVTALSGFLSQHNNIGTVIADGAPARLPVWGVDGALRYLRAPKPVRILHAADSDRPALGPAEAAALVHWNAAAGRLETLLRIPGAPEASWIDMSGPVPLWQLESGWYQREDAYRWTAPQATARLWRPAEASRFVIRLNLNPATLAEGGPRTLRVNYLGSPLQEWRFTTPGWPEVEAPLPAGDPGPVTLELITSPPYRPSNGDPRTLGIPIGAFGFR